MGKTLNESIIVKKSSGGRRGAVLRILPPTYVKSICTEQTRSIIKMNARFSESPEKSLNRSVLQLKQLKSDEKIKSAKNAVKR